MKRLYIIGHVNNFLQTHVYPFLIMNMAFDHGFLVFFFNIHSTSNFLF